MGKTKIEWVRNADGSQGKTWNPVTGCVKVSAGCKHCYAERQMKRFEPDRKFTDVQLHEKRLDYPLQWSKPSMIFVNSMSDLFQNAVPDEFIARVFEVMFKTPQHTYQILTKRPERVLKWFSKNKHTLGEPYNSFHGGCTIGGDVWPLPNVWIGVSIEDQKSADERLPIAEKIPAVLRFISAEPLIGPVDLMPHLNGDFHWVIVGGESGSKDKARPMNPIWARGIRNDCQDQGLPFLFKQWGNWEPVYEAIYTGGEIHGKANYMRYKYNQSKKAAGRLLDGILYDEFPEVKA